MKEFSILEFAHVLTELAEVEAINHEALERSAVIVEKEAKRVIGTYDYGWPSLADSTKKQRVALGFAEDEPGLRTGEMRDSIEHTVLKDEALVGSDDDKLVYFELGTSKQPARPVLMGAAVHMQDRVADEIGRVIVAYLALEKLPAD